MKIEATATAIRALLELAELDGEADPLAPDASRRQRETLERRVPQDLLERYRLLLEVGRLPAVVPIEGGTCSGCHVRLPTMVEYQARRAPAVHKCPHCRRLLYAPELVREGPPAVAAGKPAVAAAKKATKHARHERAR